MIALTQLKSINSIEINEINLINSLIQSYWASWESCEGGSWVLEELLGPPGGSRGRVSGPAEALGPRWGFWAVEADGVAGVPE